MKKISSKKTRNTSVLVVGTTFFAVILSSCQAMPFFKEKLPTTPYALPIDISKKGNKAEIDLRVKSDKERKSLEPKIVAFELRFVPYDPRRDKNSKYYPGFWRRNFYDVGMFRRYFREYSNEERDEISKDHERVLKLMEREEFVKSSYCDFHRDQCLKESGVRSYRKIIHKGIPIPNIRITITDLNDPNKKVVYDEVLEVKQHPNKWGYFNKFLSYIKLVPSNYKIVAEVQSDALEFEGTKVFIIIGSERAWWK